MANFNWHKLVMVLSIAAIVVPSINDSTNQRKLDDTSIKCGCSSCNPCYVSPPPPPPSLPPPPPSCPPPPVMVQPPPPPKKPPTPSLNCPPPPLIPFAPFIYVPGPPGNLYPIDNNYSGSRRSLSVGSPAAVICGLVGVFMAFW